MSYQPRIYSRKNPAKITREDVNSAVDEFLKGGGKIKKVVPEFVLEDKQGSKAGLADFWLLNQNRSFL